MKAGGTRGLCQPLLYRPSLKKAQGRSLEAETNVKTMKGCCLLTYSWLLIGFPAQPAFSYKPRPSAQGGTIHCEPGPHIPTINLDNVHRLAYTTD